MGTSNATTMARLILEVYVPHACKKIACKEKKGMDTEAFRVCGGLNYGSGMTVRVRESTIVR